MKLADTIKHFIEEKVCPIHDVHPVVEMIGEEINVACCCTFFERYCTIEIEYMKSQIKPIHKHIVGLQYLNLST
jgi:hypothetical protein